MRPRYIFLLFFFIISGANAQTLIKDINPGSSQSGPTNFIQMGNNTYFIANDGTHGYELWKTDGTTLGTSIVLDINPGSNDGLGGYYDFLYYFSPIVVMDNNLYFFANDNNSTINFELWKSDGTAQGTMMVKDINPGTSGAVTYYLLNNNALVKAGSYLYFGADNGVDGLELWKSDGSSNGTSLLKNISPSSYSGPNSFFADGNTVYFSADDGTHGYELWKSDGTTGGTAMVKDINPNTDGSYPGLFIKMGSKIYFNASDPIHAFELWSTDGTEGGTSIVADINPNGSSSISDIVVYKDHLLFEAIDATNQYELWSSDGTNIGTVLLKNINPSASGYPSLLTVFNDKVYFSADDGTHGAELWVTDGTTLGTSLFLDIDNVSDQPSTPCYFYASTNGLYFQANDGTNGAEPWVTDGTISGTQMLGQLCPSSCSSYPQHFFQGGNNLFFTAYEPNTHFELYKIDLPTGTKEISNDVKLNIYPNPSSDELNISFNKNTGNKTQITIKNLAGQTVLTQFVNPGNTSINIASLTPGMYFLDLHDGILSLVRKFIKD